MPCNATKDDDSLTRFVSDINGKIVPFSMRIKHGVSEDDGQRFYALVNLKDNDLSKCATMFSGNEMTYFKKLVSGLSFFFLFESNLHVGNCRRMELVCKVSPGIFIGCLYGFLRVRTRRCFASSPAAAHATSQQSQSSSPKSASS